MTQSPSDQPVEFDPHHYWSNLVSGDLTLDRVGNVGCGIAFNEWIYRQKGEALHRALRDANISLAGTSIFEAAFGVGYYLSRWRSHGVGQVTGVDLSADAVEQARMEYPDFDLQCQDLAELAPSPTPFDVVFAIDVLYHIIDDVQWDRAVRNLARRVRAGGALVFTDQFWAVRTHRSAHVRRRRFEDYVEVLGEEGLTIEVRRVFTRYLGHDRGTGMGPLWPFLRWKWTYRLVRAATRLGVLPFLGDTLGRGLYERERQDSVTPESAPSLEVVVALRA